MREVGRLKKGQGWDAANNRYGTMTEFGIIDPALVTKAALENAVSDLGVIVDRQPLTPDVVYAMIATARRG